MKIGHMIISFSIRSEMPPKVTRIIRFPLELYANIRAIAKAKGKSNIDVIMDAVALLKWTRENVIAPELRLCAVTKRGVIQNELVFKKEEEYKQLLQTKGE